MAGLCRLECLDMQSIDGTCSLTLYPGVIPEISEILPTWQKNAKDAKVAAAHASSWHGFGNLDTDAC